MTKQDKKQLIDAIKSIDVKKMELDHSNSLIQKWFRFGSFNMARIICEIIKQWPEDETPVIS